MVDKLTIAIPTYNRNDYLKKLLKSIPEDFEGKVVVSDNGGYVSEEIKDIFSKYNFIINKEKLTAFQNWNVALNNVTTEWLIMTSDDDLFCADSFVTINKVLNENPEGDIFVFGHNVIDENDNFVDSWQPHKRQILIRGEGFNIFKKGVEARCTSVIMKTSFAKKMGGFDESLEITAADSFLIQKCLLYGTSVFIPEIIANYRIWTNNFTNQLISTKAWMDKIELWTDKLVVILKDDFSKFYTPHEINNIKDEICARNLVSGLSKLRKREGFRSALKFLECNRYPYKGDFNTQLRIIKILLIG